MSWGGGWGNRTPETATIVAQAFFAGKPRKRSNCECVEVGKNVWKYFLEGSVIAIRTDVVQEITDALTTGRTPSPELQWTWAGWPTQMTARHLNALGVKAELRTDYRLGPKGGRGLPFKVCLLNGKLVMPGGWYSAEALAKLPDYEPEWNPCARREERAARAAEKWGIQEAQLQLDLA